MLKAYQMYQNIKEIRNALKINEHENKLFKKTDFNFKSAKGTSQLYTKKRQISNK